jgi:hypothetical protein
MPPSIKMRCLFGWLFGVLAFAGCAADTTTGASGVSIELELADGTEIDEVNYVVSLRGDELHSGTINTGSPGSTASIEIYGLAEDQGYVFSMSATSTDGETTCSGSAIFNVFVGQVTPVAVVLRCKPPPEFGSVRVNGQINFCAEIRWADVSPLRSMSTSSLATKKATQLNTVGLQPAARSPIRRCQERPTPVKRSVCTRSPSRCPTTASNTAIASGMSR